jgi:ornithine carbamoyltransferase
MAVNLAGRSFVNMTDFSPEELWEVLRTAEALKLERYRGQSHPLLAGKTLAMIFQKPSLRTRVSFEAGMTQLGGHAIYLAPSDIKLGHRETTEDIAIVLARFVDLIMARTFGHDIVEDLAEYATCPVINGLSEREHPCQAMADLQTIWEKKGRLAGLKMVYVGDGNNVAHSLMYSGALTGMHVAIATPPGFEPAPDVLTESRDLACEYGGSVEIGSDLMALARDADVLYTDVWASMGQEDEAEQRRGKFEGYQINARLMDVARSDAIILHCLPAHYGEEIDYDTSRLPNAAIFDQAENRLHAQKAIMALLAR